MNLEIWRQRFLTIGKQVLGSALGRSERRCAMCGAVFVPYGDSTRTRVFCPLCRQSLARREHGYCPFCGDVAAWPDLPLSPCLECMNHPPPWQGLLFHGLHQGSLRQCLLALKFGNQPAMGHTLGSLLAEHPLLENIGADLVIPVPLHRTRLMERGYNQALEIARPLAVRLGVPLWPEALVRIRATRPQTGTSLAERKKNTLNAFMGDANIARRRIVLVDDTMTTGSTLRAATLALLSAGAASVGIAVVSRTSRFTR